MKHLLTHDAQYTKIRLGNSFCVTTRPITVLLYLINWQEKVCMKRVVGKVTAVPTNHRNSGLLKPTDEDGIRSAWCCRRYEQMSSIRISSPSMPGCLFGSFLLLKVNNNLKAQPHFGMSYQSRHSLSREKFF